MFYIQKNDKPNIIEKTFNIVKIFTNNSKDKWKTNRKTSTKNQKDYSKKF